MTDDTAMLKLQDLGVLTEQDPKKILADAATKAKLLKKVIENAGLIQKIGNGKHLRIEGWLTVARFFGLWPTVEWTRELTNPIGEVTGFTARVSVVHLATGQLVTAAEMECRRDEQNWREKPLFQLKSMAQTRAAGKALRNVLSWVVVMAGYEATPSEEITGEAAPAVPPVQEPLIGSPGGQTRDWTPWWVAIKEAAFAKKEDPYAFISRVLGKTILEGQAKHITDLEYQLVYVAAKKVLVEAKVTS